MKNYWTARAEPVLAEWEATFPPIEREVCHLLQLAQGIIEAGGRESVYRLLETRSPHAFHLKPTFSYVDYLQEMMAKTGRLPLFSHGSGVACAPTGKLRTPSRIAFVDVDGNLVEDEVENVGLLLKRLRPCSAANGGEAYMSQVAPVTIENWPPIAVGKERRGKKRARPIRLTISLYTDIWFPSVIGWLDEEGCDQFKENRLAYCHTPRFNRFIERVRQLVLNLGGAWQLRQPEGSAKLYAPMIDDYGIKLTQPHPNGSHQRHSKISLPDMPQKDRPIIHHPAISDNLALEVQRILFSERQKAKAIKRVREETNLGLLEAYTYVDTLLAHQPPAHLLPQMERQVRLLLGQGHQKSPYEKRAEAIKWLRANSRLGIKEARSYVDGLMDG